MKAALQRTIHALILYLSAEQADVPYLPPRSLKGARNNAQKPETSSAAASPRSRRDAVKGRGVGKAALKGAVHRRLGRHAAVRVHGYRQLRAPPHAALVLAPEAPVAARQLQLIVAVAAQAGRAHLRTQQKSRLVQPVDISAPARSTQRWC